MLSSGFKKNTPQGIHLPSGSEHGAGQAFWFSGLILHCGGLGETPSEQRPLPPKTPHLPLPASAAHTALPPTVAVVTPWFQPYHWLLHALPSAVGTHSVWDKPSLHGGHLWPVPGPQLCMAWLAFRKAGFTKPHSPLPHPLFPVWAGVPSPRWGPASCPLGTHRPSPQGGLPAS